MKKRKIAILAVMLVCLLCAVLFQACGKRTELPKIKPVSVDSYISEFADVFASSFDTSNGVIDFSVEGNAESEGINYGFSLSFVCDLNDMSKSLMVLGLDVGGEKVFSIYAKDAYSYVDIAPNEYVGDAKIKLLNTNIFSWLKSSLSSDNSTQSDASAQIGEAAKSRFADLIFRLGKFLFREADVNADKTEYTFFFKDSLSSDKSTADLASLLGLFDKAALDSLLKVFDIASYSELAKILPSAMGTLTFSVSGGKLNGIKSNNLQIGSLAFQSLDLSVKTDNIDRDALDDKFPKSDTGYLVTKIGNMASKGTVALYDKNGNKRAVTFDYEINTNLDLITLLAADFDLSKLSQDNYFHFSLTHKCDTFCTEFCRSKLRWDEKTSCDAIIDIAYSPTDLGSSNVVIIVNLFYLLGEDYFESINKYPQDIMTTSMTEYCIFTVPYEKFAQSATLKDMLILLYANMLKTDSKYSLETDKLLSLMDEQSLAYELFSQFTQSEEFSATEIRIKSDYRVYGQSNEYDIYEKAFYDAATGKLKIYNHVYLDIAFPGGLRYGALDWTLEDDKTTRDGVTLTNIYSANGDVMHGVSEGEYVPLSPYEARGLQGYFLKADLLSFKKDILSGELLEIVDATEIDFAYLNPQTVKLKIRYPSPLDFAFTAKLFESYYDDFCVSVSVRIKLTHEVSSALYQDISENAVFKPVNANDTESIKKPPEFLLGVFRIEYVGGLTKEIAVEGQSKDVVSMWITMPGMGEKRYHITNWGMIDVDFKMANRVITKSYNIKTPDRFEFVIDPLKMGNPVVGNRYLTALMTTHAKLYAYYGDTAVQIYLSPEDFFINGIPAAQSSSYWKSYPSILTGSARLVFYIANTYEVQIIKNGEVSEKFNLEAVLS